MAGDPKEKKILVVDDDESICFFLKTLLEKEGFGVEVCYDGSAAVKVFNRNKIDLIVLDWMMPVLSGFEVLKTLRSDKHGKVPVVVVTAQVTDAVTIDTIKKEMNVAEFISKPINNTDFISRVHKVLGTSGTK